MNSYSQNFEDVMLSRLFEGKLDGFYIDIGAHDPDFLSVTKVFYDLGWHGINVEPLKDKWQLFQEKRLRDINIHAAIGMVAGHVQLANVPSNSALSSTNKLRQAELIDFKLPVSFEEVVVVTLNAIIEKYAPPEIDFLKIDVEGDEASILNSIDLAIHRPKVIVIESVKPVDVFPGWKNYNPVAYDNSGAWQNQLVSKGYLEAYFDGLNKFFVREDCRDLVDRLKLPPGVFDYIIPSMMDDAWSKMREKENVIQEQVLLLDTYRNEIENIEKMSRENGNLNARRELITQQLQLLDAKEKQIQEQTELIDLYRTSMETKERVIQDLSKTLRKYRLMASPLIYINRGRRYFFNIVRPRLGNLNQYAPRPLSQRSFGKAPEIDRYPTISIATPSFGQGHFIERTLQSVLDQAYPKLEYVVQDGGSTDSTVTVLKKYQSRLAAWVSEKDSGQSQAINRGLAKTSGEIMCWLNSDDILLPGALAKVADYFNRHTEVDVVYGDRLLIDENDQEIGRWIMPGHDDKVLSWVDYVPQETMFWRRRIWDKVGGNIDESFRFAMDWDLLVRFRDAGAKFAHIPQFLGGFRIHSQQKTSASINDIGHREMDRIRERVLGRKPSRKEIHKAIIPYLIKHIATDMVYRVKTRLRWVA